MQEKRWQCRHVAAGIRPLCAIDLGGTRGEICQDCTDTVDAVYSEVLNNIRVVAH